MSINELLDAYEEKRSVKAAARAAGCSWQRAMKILSSSGVITSDIHALIIKLYEKGYDLDKISQQTGISPRTIQAYLPAKRPFYNINPSENAKRIKRHREKTIKNKNGTQIT